MYAAIGCEMLCFLKSDLKWCIHLRRSTFLYFDKSMVMSFVLIGYNSFHVIIPVFTADVMGYFLKSGMSYQNVFTFYSLHTY